MHCPKCGQNYHEGSQRFCDIDGARLISLSDDAYRRGKQGVFSTLFPKLTFDEPSEEVNDVTPQYIVSEIDEKETDDAMEAMFFEEDEDEVPQFAAASEPVFEVLEEPRDGRVFGRKVDPDDIPAGHVDIDKAGDRDHPSINDLEFDVDDPESFIGRTVRGRYRVIELLGEDDTGFAFLAEDRIANDKLVLVRILTNELFDEVTESIFAEERVSLSHLNHPNIERLVDSGEFIDGTNFLISEHLDVLSVDDVLQIHGPLEATRAARIVRQAGYALSDVHNEGILHRDLRPAYMKLDHPDGDKEIVKISNFGVSDGEPNSENLPYKAPEILDGGISTFSSDIYSLGVIAYRILTGRTPFAGDTQRDLLRSERAGLKIYPTVMRRDIIPAVDYVFDKVLAADPLLRYPTAREFGDALYGALTAVPAGEAVIHTAAEPLPPETHPDEELGHVQKNIKGPAVIPATILPKATSTTAVGDAAWTRRSPELSAEPGSSWVKIAVIGFVALLAIAAGIWYYLLQRPAEPDAVVQPEVALIPEKVDPSSLRPDGTLRVEVPPLARVISQPPDTDFFQNTKRGLKGDLLRNFVGFSLYYPKDWTVNGPHESVDGKARGKFLDISRNTSDGKMKEQMLVSYYPSNGTFNHDAVKFTAMAGETNEILKKLIPNYQLVSDGNTTINGGWQAYELKFQGSGTAENGERLLVWGRRLFIPAGRPGVRAGFEVTLLATSYADDVHSVDDVGTRGELAQILYTFEPSQSF
jgi:serine/threonine protein kinase